MLLIFILKSVTDRILPCGTPSSCLYRLENVDRQFRTLNRLSERKLLMKFSKFPRSPKLWRSFTILNLHMVSEAFSRSKKTAIVGVVSGYWPLLWRFQIWLHDQLLIAVFRKPLSVCDEFIGFEIPNQSSVYYALHCLPEATSIGLFGQ